MPVSVTPTRYPPSALKVSSLMSFPNSRGYIAWPPLEVSQMCRTPRITAASRALSEEKAREVTILPAISLAM
jgi:hypothetical protein